MKSTLQFIFILLITFTAVRVDADTCVWKLGMSQEQINELIKADDFEMAAKEDTWFILFIPSERKNLMIITNQLLKYILALLNKDRLMHNIDYRIYIGMGWPHFQ